MLMTETMLDAALEYAAEGIAVFPCRRDKAPITTNGFKDATTDAENIRGAWREYGYESLIGAAVPEGVVIIDIDPRNGGTETIKALKDEGLKFPFTKTARTGGNGFHRWYSTDIPPDRLKSILGDGVDVKRHGKGYVIMPPSESTSGRYRWMNDDPIAKLPKWLEQRLLKPERVKVENVTLKTLPEGTVETSYGAEALRQECMNIASARPGERNDQLNKSAYSVYQLVYGGELDADYASEKMLRAAESAGLEPFECMKTLESAFVAAGEAPRVAPESKTFGDFVRDRLDPPEETSFWTNWLVDAESPPFYLFPVLPKNAYVIVYGGTEAAKSMVWNALLAQGSHVGLKSSVYSLENPAHVDRNRLRRLAPDPDNFRLTNHPTDLAHMDSLEALIKREQEFGTDVLLFDTYSHVYSSKSTDGNAKAIEFARIVRHIMQEVGCSVIVIDHTGYENREEPRDASAKRQQVDVAIFMEREGQWQKGRPAKFRMTNFKSARFANPFEDVRGQIADTDNEGLELLWAESDFGSRWEL